MFEVPGYFYQPTGHQKETFMFSSFEGHILNGFIFWMVSFQRVLFEAKNKHDIAADSSWKKQCNPGWKFYLILFLGCAAPDELKWAMGYHNNCPYYMTSLPEKDNQVFLHQPENDFVCVCRHGPWSKVFSTHLWNTPLNLYQQVV